MGRLRTNVPEKQLPRSVLKGTCKSSNVLFGHMVGPHTCVCTIFGRTVRHVFRSSLVYTLSAISFESRELQTTIVCWAFMK
jgi:hypothetical protein